MILNLNTNYSDFISRYGDYFQKNANSKYRSYILN